MPNHLYLQSLLYQGNLVFPDYTHIHTINRKTEKWIEFLVFFCLKKVVSFLLVLLPYLTSKRHRKTSNDNS